MSLEESIFTKLKCKYCNDYTKEIPIMMQTDSENLVCATCFKILPEEIRDNHERQRGLEFICEEVLFPCRYRSLGCLVRFKFNTTTAKEHDTNCSHRYTTEKSSRQSLDLINFSNRSSRRISESDGEIYDINPSVLSCEMKCNFKRNLTTRKITLLRFEMAISGNTEELYTKRNNSSTGSSYQAINILIEGRVLLASKDLDVIITSIGISPKSSPQLELTPMTPNCTKCHENIFDFKAYRCSTGHDTCTNCKVGSCCNTCRKTLPALPAVYCKYYDRGCGEYIPADRVQQHIDQCEFQDYKCPMPGCTWMGTISTMQIVHLQIVHAADTFHNQEIKIVLEDEMDKNWLMICYGKVFLVKQFSYGCGMFDLVVEYLGSAKNSERFKYTIARYSSQGDFPLECVCSTGNTSSLDKGIQFECFESYELTIRQIR